MASRNYRAEYRRRLARAASRGLGRTQARGHARGAIRYEPELEAALKSIRDGQSLSAASRSHHVAPERLRAYLGSTGVGKKVGRSWTIGTDNRPRVLPIFSRGRRHEITVRDYESARVVGLYMQTVYGPFLERNDASVLAPFAGQGVHDTHGRFYPFEVRPNELYRLTLAGPEPFEQIYQIVM